MSTYGPFSTYAIALVLDQDSKWAPLVICMKDDERNRLGNKSFWKTTWDEEYWDMLCK